VVSAVRNDSWYGWMLRKKPDFGRGSSLVVVALLFDVGDIVVVVGKGGGNMTAVLLVLLLWCLDLFGLFAIVVLFAVDGLLHVLLDGDNGDLSVLLLVDDLLLTLLAVEVFLPLFIVGRLPLRLRFLFPI